jgi:hypothetical protein
MMIFKWFGICVLVLVSASHAGFAQDLRDPTAPPAEASSAVAGVAKTPWGTDGMAVVVRDGKSYLVVDTRLYSIGQKVGYWRVAKITETEVWMRNGKELRKVPRFAGVQRSETAPPPPKVIKP